MDTKRLTTAGILGVVATVMFYIAALLMLFFPVCNVAYELYGTAGNASTLLGAANETLTGIGYMMHSGLHIFFFIAVILMCAAAIPMFGDSQMNARSCVNIIRCIMMCIVFIFLIAFMMDVMSPLATLYSKTTVKIKSFVILTGGALVALLSVVALILTIVSTVLCSVEKESVRRTAFFASQCKSWRAEECLISVFTAICGGVVACIPYALTKNYWKRKYGDIQTAQVANHEVMPSAVKKRVHSAKLNYYGYAAKLLTSYKELLDNGTITQFEYDTIKEQLLSDVSTDKTGDPPPFIQG